MASCKDWMRLFFMLSRPYQVNLHHLASRAPEAEAGQLQAASLPAKLVRHKNTLSFIKRTIRSTAASSWAREVVYIRMASRACSLYLGTFSMKSVTGSMAGT